MGGSRRHRGEGGEHGVRCVEQARLGPVGVAAQPLPGAGAEDPLGFCRHRRLAEPGVDELPVGFGVEEQAPRAARAERLAGRLR